MRSRLPCWPRSAAGGLNRRGVGAGSWSSSGTRCRKNSANRPRKASGAAGAGAGGASGGGWGEVVPAAPDGRAEVVERVGQARVRLAQRLLEGDRRRAGARGSPPRRQRRSSRWRATKAPSTGRPCPGTTTVRSDTWTRWEVRVSAHSSGQQSSPNDGWALSSTRSPRNIASVSGTSTATSPSVWPRPAYAIVTTRSPRSMVALEPKVRSGPRTTVAITSAASRSV